MALTLQLFAALALAAAASAHTEFCPPRGQYNPYTWYVQPNVDISVQTTYAGSFYYSPSMSCLIFIKADRPGRILVRVTQNDLTYNSPSIYISTDIAKGYLANWNKLTYSPNRHGSFVSDTKSLYISFSTTNENPSASAQGVRLQLTFLPPDGCLPGWAPLQLAGQRHCIGRPTSTPFKFGDAQGFCKLWRSNLLVSDRDNVSSVLALTDANSAWIGMTAEPSGSVSYFRWINNAPVGANLVNCFLPCTPGSTKHRCVQAQSRTMLVQTDCGTALPPICYMPVGGTDIFYQSSATVRASGALLASAALLVWNLLR